LKHSALGIVGLIVGCIGAGFFTMPLGVITLICGILGRREKGTKPAFANLSIIFGVLETLAGIAMYITPSGRLF
jgi:hypothetical protein